MADLMDRINHLAGKPKRPMICIGVEVCIVTGKNPFELKINQALAAAQESDLPDLFYALFHLWLSATQTTADKQDDTNLLHEAKRIFGPALGRCHCGKQGGIVLTLTADGKNLALWQDMPAHIAGDRVTDNSSKPVFSVRSANGQTLDAFLNAVFGVAASHLEPGYCLYPVLLPNGSKLFIKIANPDT